MSKSHRLSEFFRRQKHSSRRQLMSGLEILEKRLALTVGATITNTSTGGYYNDAVLVRFQPGTSNATMQSLVTSANGTIAKQYSGALTGLVEVDLQAASQNTAGVQNALNSLQQSTSVLYAEPNYRYTFNLTPNDPRYSEQQGLNNTGQLGGTPDADIDAPEAWNFTTGSKNVVVAVIDTGIDATHPDLAGNLWSNPGEVPGDGIDNDGNGFVDDTYGWDMLDNDAVPEDTVDHGTHVAGTIGAVGNNSVGVTGVNWNVSLMILKAGDDTGLPLTAIVGSDDYVTSMRQRGINVVASNNSYGGYNFSQAQRDAIAANNAAGVLFVAAAGNDSIDNDSFPHYPSSFNLPNIIAVAATDRNDQLATFSNTGATTVDLGAPGVAILSTFPVSDGGYGIISGTSMASPHVAGAVALLSAADPTLTAPELKDFILQGVDPLPSLSGQVLTGGRLNIFKSIDLIPRSYVQGTVYTDKLGDGIIQANDSVLAGVTVYYDANNNGLLDSSEARTVSNAAGAYTLGPVSSRTGAATIRIVLPPNYSITVPRVGSYSIIFSFNGETRTGVDFGLYGQPGQISGHKWLDYNSNASLDPAMGDGPLGGIFIFVDIDNDGRAGIGEPAAVTANDGSYLIKNVPVGTYALREILQPGTATAFPATNNGAYIFNMTAKGVLTGYDFFNSPAYDYGDAPNSYQTLLASGGPVHGYLAGYQLGARLDADANGQPTVGANGDDNTFSDDEDGIKFLNFFTPGATSQVQVTVNVPSNKPAGYLNAFVDFNRDGDFNDAGEKIFDGLQLGTGVYTLNVNVPASAVIGTTYARFRYGSEASLGPGGRSAVGEVEDYTAQILLSTPTAVTDGDPPPLDPQTADISVQQFSLDNPIDVLANDLRSSRGPIHIVSAPFAGTGKTTDLGGKVTYSNNGTPTDLSDDFLLYDAAPAPANSAGQTFYVDHFKYMITDGFSNSTADVYVTVNKISTAPVAIDDTYIAKNNTATSNNTTILNVLANDIAGKKMGVQLNAKALVSFDTQAFNAAGDVVGTITRDARGTYSDKTDDRLIFTALPGVNNTTGTFTYTINNPQDLDPALRRTATVTVQIRSAAMQPDPTDDVAVSIQVFTVNANGNPGTRVDSGTGPHNIVENGEYWVGVYAKDLRGPVTVGGNEGNGALAVYLDFLYDARYVDLVRLAPADQLTPEQQKFGFDIRFSAPYDTASTSGSTSAEGSAATPGIIDEVGNFALNTPGDGNKIVFFVKFKVKDVPNNIIPTTGMPFWRTDPADKRSDVDPTDPTFDNDIIVNDEVTGSIRAVPIDDVAYLPSSNFKILAAPSATLASLNSAPTATAPLTPTAPQAKTAAPSTPSAASSTTTSISPSQNDLLASVSSLSLSSITSSSKTTSVSTQATDSVFASLYANDLLPNGKKK